jgi:membrane protein required for beta-lactamase induction
MRHPFITAQLLRQARAAIDVEASERPAQDAVPDLRVRRLLVWSAAILMVAALVALGVPLPAGATHARLTDERAEQALERTLAREHHAVSGPADKAAKVAQRTLAREHHAVPAPTGQQATSAQPAESSRTRPLLVVVGAPSLIVVLIAGVTLLRLRARPRAAT